PVVVEEAPVGCVRGTGFRGPTHQELPDDGLRLAVVLLNRIVLRTLGGVGLPLEAPVPDAPIEVILGRQLRTALGEPLLHFGEVTRARELDDATRRTVGERP